MSLADRRQDFPAHYGQGPLQMCATQALTACRSCTALVSQYFAAGAQYSRKFCPCAPLKFYPVCVYKNLLHDTTAASILLVAFSRTVSCKNLQPPFWGATAPAWWPL